jgi:hypothetical protein
MALHGIAMDVISMMHKINAIPNAMIGESALPDFLVASDDGSEFMRVGTLDQLDSVFDRSVVLGCQQKMNVLGHNDKSMQPIAAVATMSVERFEEEPYINFNSEEFSAVECGEGHEIRSRRGKESSRLQERTSAAGSRTSSSTLNWHEWNSCPSRWFFLRELSFWERSRPSVTTRGSRFAFRCEQ